MLFSPPQISIVNRSFGNAEEMVRKYFGLSEADLKEGRYDFRTLAELEEHEVKRDAFAHLCRYYCRKGDESENAPGYYLYRICLQDDRILDAVNRGVNFIKLFPLLLYIATHELVHVVRFTRGESDFDAHPGEKQEEERRVHNITRNVLRSNKSGDLELVLDCFSHSYHIGDFN